jgi:outer membrane receptor for ferrienterochelin and colicins
MMVRPCATALLFLLASAAAAQRAPADSVRDLGRVVVTATRSTVALEDVPVPTTVVSAEDAQADGALRLPDLLQAIPGLALTSDFGTGVQVQGLDAAYTLILIDGEPVIGRMSGVLDLDRLALGGLDRVELVRGPSSSLYGSEALAGVINLITRAPQDLRGRVSARTGTFATTNLAGEVEGGTEIRGRAVGARLLVDRYATAGYDLQPEVFGPTTPQTEEVTADLRLRAELSGRTRLRLGARTTGGLQQQSYAFTDAGGGVDEIDQTERRRDWSVHPELRHAFGGRLAGRLSAYAAGYRLDTDVVRRADGVRTYEEGFDQRILKADAQLDALWSARHRTAGGAGGWRDALAGERYSAERPRALTGYVFAQHDWAPDARLALNASARFDAHSDFGSSLSPKLSVLWRPQSYLRVRTSVGTGFKAPDTRQLYLSFTNDVGGYLIFGAARVEEALARLDAEGRLGQRYVSAERLGAIVPESSVALNAEVEVEPTAWVRLTLGGFRNAVRDLIEVQPVAELTSGTPVYGYVNLARIRTQGLTADLSAAPPALPGVTVAAGYQWLRSRDLDLAEQIAAGTVFGRDAAGRDVRLTPADYTNLLGRSAHQGTLRVAYRTPGAWTATLRGRLRGAYGLRDLDGNGLANRPDEFVPATALWDATLSRDLALGRALPGRALRVQLGLDNLLGTTRPTLVPSLAGRRLYGALSVTF